MSRRAKLIILAIFLVLLGIPTVYVVGTWHPERPLRFRLVELHIRMHPRDGYPIRVLELDIENVSAAPVLLHGAFALDGPTGNHESGYLGEVDPKFDEERGVFTSLVIPPRGTIRRNAVLRHEMREVPVHEIQFEYIWNSRTRQVAARAWYWANDPLPRKWTRHLTPFTPPCRDREPLEVGPDSGHTSSPATSPEQ